MSSRCTARFARRSASAACGASRRTPCSRSSRRRRRPRARSAATVLKPGVVLFGELLPAAAMERATHLARSARLVLVVGSSLEVWPVAGLPLEARGFAIVNRGPTALDERALLKVDAGAGGDALRGARPARGLPGAARRKTPHGEAPRPLATSRGTARSRRRLSVRPRGGRRSKFTECLAPRGLRRAQRTFAPLDRAREGDAHRRAAARVRVEDGR